MIPSYQEELRIHRNKSRFFWTVVVVFAVFLFYFFQGYYFNYRQLFHMNDESKKTFLKPFGIIDVRVFPSPDDIKINNEDYDNNSKTIFDLGKYNISIQKKGYIPLVFPVDIAKDHPFYTNTVNLIRLPKYSTLPVDFERVYRVDKLFFVQVPGSKNFLVLDSLYRILSGIVTTYDYIGGVYFTDRRNIFKYNIDTDKFKTVLSKENIPVQCAKTSWYNEMIFCLDTMQFIDQNIPDIPEKILRVNENIIFTTKYIYNQNESDTNWRYYQYQSGTLSIPESLIHINSVPFALEK